MNDSTRLIAVDWGTTTLRAYRIIADGQVAERQTLPLGILKVPGGYFDSVYAETFGHWLAGDAPIPVIAAGMIGSRQGWLEVPYLTPPSGAAEFAGALGRVTTRDGRTMAIVPGVAMAGEDGVPDVIRGEETQVIGAHIRGRAASGLVVVPGTHSKWILAEGGRITWFATFMTGEVFAILCEHSILGRLMQDERPDQAAFRRGLDHGRSDDPRSAGLLHKLFSTRTLGLFDKVPGEALRSYLSGLLIGAEIAEASRAVAARLGHVPSGLTVIGGAILAQAYGTALRHAGFTVADEGEDAMIGGLVAIAEAAGLTRGS